MVVMPRSRALWVPLLMCSLSACSEQDDRPDGSTARDEAWPSCEVFVEGARIADDARGCLNSTGAKERYNRIPCLDGSVMIVYAEETWTRHGVVREAGGDELQADYIRCIGESAFADQEAP